MYVDEDYDFQIKVPEGWFRADPKNYRSAGELCRVWTPGQMTSIMVYRYVDKTVHLPISLLDQTAESFTTQRNAEVLEQEVRKVSGKQAAWLVVVGNGNGGAIDGKGNIRTTQHMVAIPRVDDVIVLMFVAPEEDVPKYHPAFEKLLESIKVDGEQTQAQQNSQ